METPLVSVIIMTYNSSETVIATLDSVAAQSYGNIELVIADDGSMDNTQTLVRGWMACNEGRFVALKPVFSFSNEGITANAARGVGKSHGRWIKLLAGDDIMLPNAIECFVAEAERGEGDFFFSRMELFSHVETEDVSLNRIMFYDVSYAILRNNYSAGEQEKILRYSMNFCPAPAAFFSKKAFLDIGGFDRQVAMAEDLPLWFRATRNGYRLNFIDEALVRYRVGAGSVQRTHAFSVTRRVIKYKYLLRTPGFGIYGRIDHKYRASSVKNKICFALLKSMSVARIYSYRRRAKDMAEKYSLSVRQIS